MLLSIFPDGNTLLHLLANDNQILDDIKTKLQTQYLYPQNEQVNALYLDQQERGCKFLHIKNQEGLTPIHLAIEKENSVGLDILLKMLEGDTFGRHTFQIAEILPDIICMESQNLQSYLNSRLLQTPSIAQIKRGAIEFNEEVNLKPVQVSSLTDSQEMSEILDDDSTIQKDIKLTLCDIPNIHLYSDISSYRLFQRLSQVQNLELFKLKLIQGLIYYKWEQARKFSILWLFIPFVLFHAAFIAYSNVFSGQLSYDENEHPNLKKGQIALAVILYFFCVYFLSNELRQVVNNGALDYLLSIWNYIDILPILLIIIVVTSHLSMQYSENYEQYNFLYTIHALASMFMWLKFLYFLRLFDSTGYLVRTLVGVIWDMKVFLLILGIVYCAFGEAYLRLAEPMEDEELRYVTNFANAFVFIYRMSLVDNNTDAFEMNLQPTTLWILFIITGIVLPIIMLNLLIAIISLSFEKINENAELAAIQEKARIIFENYYLIPSHVKRRLDNQSKFLGIILDTTTSSDSNGGSDVASQEVLNLVSSLKTQVEGVQESLKTEFKQKMIELQAQQSTMAKNISDYQAKTSEQLTQISASISKLLASK